MPRIRKAVPAACSERERELRSRYGGYMTVTDVMREIGCCRMTAQKFMSDVDGFMVCGKKHYQTADFARKIEECRVPAGA